jgi:hypothetical protein
VTAVRRRAVRLALGWAYLRNGAGAGDNYQCKHYDHRLAPGDVWSEIAKPGEERDDAVDFVGFPGVGEASDELALTG